MASLAHLGPTGVDEQAGVVFSYSGGKTAAFTTSLQVNSPIEARVIGTTAQILLQPRWYRTRGLTLSTLGEADQHFDFPMEGNGYQFQAAAVGECLRAGKLESSVMPLDETLSILRTMDALRREWGLRYPSERL